jgi:hypothetical protein
VREFCPPYAYLQALRHGAELIDEIRAGSGQFSRSLFNTFNKERSRHYDAWLRSLEPIARASPTLESFACELSISLQ